jgi:PAS domain S-box-containing protein
MALPKASAIVARQRFIRRISEDTPFYRLFDLLPEVAFFAKDHEFRFMCANQRFIERFGLRDESQVIGKNDFELFPSRIAESFRRDDEEILRSGHPKLNIVELFFSDQGVPDWVVTHKMPLRDRRNRVIGVMGTVQSYESRRQVLQPYLQLDRAVAYLRENFRAGVTVKELSQVVHLSPPTAPQVCGNIRDQHPGFYHQAADPGRMRSPPARGLRDPGSGPGPGFL